MILSPAAPIPFMREWLWSSWVLDLIKVVAFLQMKGQRASEVKTARKPTTHFSLSYPPYIRDHISDGEPSPAKAEIKLAEPTYLRPTSERNKKMKTGCGGGQVVSVLAFYSDDPSSNRAGIYNFSVKIVVEKNENKKQTEAGIGHF